MNDLLKALRPPRRSVRPVSQVALELTDNGAFEQAIALSVSWLNAPRRVKGRIPDTARHGEAFDLGIDDGSMPVAAARYTDETIDVWSAKLDFPDASVVQRIWSTDIAVARAAGRTVFMTRLSNTTLGDDPVYTPSVPGVVTSILSSLSAETDGYPISETAQEVDVYNFEQFDHLLKSPDRRLPIIAVSKGTIEEEEVSSDTLVRRLAGTCHVVTIDGEASWRLTRSVGRRFSVFGGAARLYQAGFNVDRDDPYRHPLHYPADDSGVSYSKWLARRVLPQGFVRPFPGLDQLRLSNVRARVSARSRSVASSVDIFDAITADNDNLRSVLAETKKQAEQDAEAAQTLLDEAADEAERVTTERDELASENERLRAKLRALNFGGPAAESSNAELKDYASFEAWADANLGQHIEILPRAVRETEKRGTLEMLETLQASLLMLKNSYIPMKIEGGLDKNEAFRTSCKELGVEEKACFAQKGDIKAYSEYRVQRGGKWYWLDRHVKWGGGTNLRSMFRIYFHWIENESVLLIGHMPSHLDNNLTN